MHGVSWCIPPKLVLVLISDIDWYWCSLWWDFDKNCFVGNAPFSESSYHAAAARYIARKKVEDILSYDELYVASLSPKTIVYKVQIPWIPSRNGDWKPSYRRVGWVMLSHWVIRVYWFTTLLKHIGTYRSLRVFSSFSFQFFFGRFGPMYKAMLSTWSHGGRMSWNKCNRYQPWIQSLACIPSYQWPSTVDQLPTITSRTCLCRHKEHKQAA